MICRSFFRWLLFAAISLTVSANASIKVDTVAPFLLRKLSIPVVNGYAEVEVEKVFRKPECSKSTDTIDEITKAGNESGDPIVIVKQSKCEADWNRNVEVSKGVCSSDKFLDLKEANEYSDLLVEFMGGSLKAVDKWFPNWLGEICTKNSTFLCQQSTWKPIGCEVSGHAEMIIKLRVLVPIKHPDALIAEVQPFTLYMEQHQIWCQYIYQGPKHYLVWKNDTLQREIHNLEQVTNQGFFHEPCALPNHTAYNRYIESTRPSWEQTQCYQFGVAHSTVQTRQYEGDYVVYCPNDKYSIENIVIDCPTTPFRVAAGTKVEINSQKIQLPVYISKKGEFVAQDKYARITDITTAPDRVSQIHNSPYVWVSFILILFNLYLAYFVFAWRA